MVKAWAPAVPLDANVAVDARLVGDLGAPSLNEIDAEITSANGDRLELSGSLGDVWKGNGLDGRVALKIDLRGPVARALAPDWRIADRADAVAKLTGSIDMLALDEISAAIEGPGASRMTFAGSLALATGGGLRPQSFDLSTTLALPDPSAIADALGFDLSWLGGTGADAELSLVDRRIEARRLAIDADFGALHLEGRRAIGSLTADGALHLAPDISFAAAMEKSGPVLGAVAAAWPGSSPYARRDASCAPTRTTCSTASSWTWARRSGWH